MKWSIKIDRRASKEIQILPESVRNRIKLKILGIAENPLSYPHHSLKNKNLLGDFRLRIGDWRVIYSLDYENKLIIIWFVKHRSEAYK